MKIKYGRLLIGLLTLMGASATPIVAQNRNSNPFKSGGQPRTASSVRGRPAFVSGQIVVEGRASEFRRSQVVKELRRSGLVILRVPPGQEIAEANQFRERGRPADPNFLAYAFNDPYRSYQWHFENINTSTAWQTNTGSGIKVAVLDTGLAVGGQDGVGCVTNPYDVVSNDTNPDDGDGHGTHVSGTVAQATNNARGVSGVAYGSCIMPVKVLGDNGSGSFADVAEGIYYAVDSGAKVINMSLGADGFSSYGPVDAALDYAYSRGVTVVAAAGNSSIKTQVSYPAIHPRVIAVGATDYRNQVTGYSNQGLGLDLVAPGGDNGRDDNRDGYPDGVLQETRVNRNWGYYFYSGTSMASPHVAAAAAMLISSGKASTPDQVKTALISSTVDLGTSGYDATYGYGLLQLDQALSGTSPNPDPPAPTPVDADRDGYYSIASGGNDCNDNDPNINPGVRDSRGRRWRDGIDNDCNGIIDG